MPSPTAAAATILSPRRYGRLRDDVRSLLDGGRAEAEAAVGHILARTYWQVGRRILKEQLSERAGYGDGIVEQLAAELGLKHRLLQKTLQFARTHETPPKPGLSWSHYRQLMGVSDPQARAFYESRALSEGWSSRELASQVGAGSFETTSGGGGQVEGLPRPSDANYLYRCEVQRVIDGDTLVVLIDLGFNVIRRQHVRLVHVQAPEADTPGGREATRFVREAMARAQTVVVKTARQTDARGRFLAYAFYSGSEQDADTVLRQGQYLNAELVRAGLAAVQLDPTAR